MKIILANGYELDLIMVAGAKRTVQGATRDCLSFIFNDEKSLDELDAIFTEEACESINIIGDDGSEAIHTGYTIRAELTKYSEVAQTETATTESVSVTRIKVAMAQRTYQETKMREMEARLAALGV